MAGKETELKCNDGILEAENRLRQFPYNYGLLFQLYCWVNQNKGGDDLYGF